MWMEFFRILFFVWFFVLSQQCRCSTDFRTELWHQHNFHPNVTVHFVCWLWLYCLMLCIESQMNEIEMEKKKLKKKYFLSHSWWTKSNVWEWLNFRMCVFFFFWKIQIPFIFLHSKSLNRRDTHPCDKESVLWFKSGTHKLPLNTWTSIDRLRSPFSPSIVIDLILLMIKNGIIEMSFDLFL